MIIRTAVKVNCVTSHFVLHVFVNLRCAFIWQRIAVIPHRRFGTTFSPLLGLKMGPIGCPETSARNCHRTLRNNPEERRSHLLRGGSQKSRVLQT